jgi:hypothetical protein
VRLEVALRREDAGEQIIAGHQPLAGEVGRVDLGQIDFVEQRPIERALIDQLPNPGGRTDSETR